jgi:hypothetical protein
MKLDTNDPLLTAIALGEENDEDILKQLSESDEAREAVAEIRKVASLLTEAYQRQPEVALQPDQREQVLGAGSTGRKAGAGSLGYAESDVANGNDWLLRLRRRFRTQPRRYAAAAFAVLVCGAWLYGAVGRAWGGVAASTYCWIASARQSGAQKDISKDQCNNENFESASTRDLDWGWVLFGIDDSQELEGRVDTDYWQTARDTGVEEVRESAAAGRAKAEAPAAGEQPEDQAAAEQLPIMPSVGPEAPADIGVRKIVKNADMLIEVEDVSRAMGRITGAAAEMGGYVLETQAGSKEGEGGYAMLTVAVPVGNFELMLARVRDTSLEVLSEYASGRDATQEYVDLESQLANLEATQARIRDFLSQAKSVEEALKVNAQLKDIEGQISQTKGRLRYLEQRAAYSTLTVELTQRPPDVTATPTMTASPTLTPTPRPTPVVEPWQPGETVGRATHTLTGVLQLLTEIAIWLVIVALPLLLPVIVLWWISKRRREH